MVLSDFLVVAKGKSLLAGVGTGFRVRFSASWKQLVRQICKGTVEFVLI